VGYKIKIYLIIGINLIVLTSLAQAGVRMSQAQETIKKESAKVILLKMQESRARLRNVQCLVEYNDSQTYEAISRMLRDVKNKKVPPQIPAKAQAHIIKTLENKLAAIKPGTSENRFQIQKVIMDSEGRAKIELRGGDYDDTGEKVFSGFESIRGWDGVISVEYRKARGATHGSAFIDSTRPKMLNILRNPLQSFGGEFMTSLSKALEQGKDIDIEKNDESGTFKITFYNEQERKNMGIVDPAKGYSLCKRELYTGEALSVRWTANFEEFNEGVWFPTEGKIDSYFVDYPYQQDTVSTVKISNIKINDPEFNASLFHFDLPKGTRVVNINKDSTDQQIHSLLGKPLPKFQDLKVDLSPTDTNNKMIIFCFFDMEQRTSRNCLRQLSKRAQELKAKDIVVVAVQASKIDENTLNEWIKKSNIPFTVGIIEDDTKKPSLIGAYALFLG
jgi:hypothetical protein